MSTRDFSTSSTIGTSSTNANNKRRIDTNVVDEQQQVTSTSDANNDNTIRTAIIEKQKERAKQLWNESNYNEDMKTKVNKDVMENLENGLVLPIFHTLCRHPNERLFPPETRVGKNDNKCSDLIQFSSELVTMGKCKPNSDIVGKINISTEKSYIPAFFTSDSDANFKIEDSNSSWEFDDDYTEIVTNLVNAPAQMVGEDIEITKLTRPFDVDLRNGCNLITRRLSRGVVADCFNLSGQGPGTTYAITGSSGIGKSWTLVYALQQALLFDNVCVLFCYQKYGVAIVCIRRQGKVYAWKSDNGLWKTDCGSKLFCNSNVVVLLDPKESIRGGAEYTEGYRMLIMAASNNKNHFVSSVKTTPDLERILSVYTEKELEVAVPYMIENDKLTNVEEDTERILKRAKIVGPLPRYILSEKSFVCREQETINAINMLLTSDKIEQEIGCFRGMIDNNSTVLKCLFAVNVRLASNIKLNTATADQHIIQNNDNYGPVVGYDGQCIKSYFKREVSVMSEYVSAAIAQSSRKDVLSFLEIYH